MMRILIDLRPLLYNCVSEEAKRFIITGLSVVTAENPKNDWFFLVNKSYTDENLFNISKEKLIVKKSIPGKLGWKIWYKWQIPGIIKKHKADLLITTGGVGSVAAILQCIWMPGIIEKNKSYFSFYKKKLQSTLRKAWTVFVFSEKDKQRFINEYKLPGNKLTVIRSAPEAACNPLPWTEKENIKIKYAGSKEYFIITGSLQQHHLITVLKAFSQFKKRQQSNMQLVLAVKNLNKDIGFAEKLDNYKYRPDVYICDHLSEHEMIKIISAAYALICPVHEGEPANIVLNACKAGVPVITTDTGCVRETVADAVLYADITNQESLSAQLILLYKDEALRNRLIEKGKIQAEQFNWQQINKQIWEGVLNAMNK
jgi:glycosyltransferase involved in cell wall biosynthesis